MTTMVQVQRVLKVEPVGTPYIRSTDGKRVRKIQKTILIRQRKNKKTTRGGDDDDDDCCFDNNNDNNNRNNGEHATTTSGTKTGIVSNDDPITGTGVLIHHVEGGQPHNGNNDVMYYRNKDGKYVRRIRKTRRKLKEQQQQQQELLGLLNDLEQTDRFLPEKVNETTCCPSIEHDESGIDLSRCFGRRRYGFDWNGTICSRRSAQSRYGLYRDE